MLRRVAELSDNVILQLKGIVQQCNYFSLAVDKSIDISGITQPSIFIRAVEENFTVCKSISTSWNYKRYRLGFGISRF